jgi:hypothetical protein
MMKNKLFVLVVAVVLTGCTTTRYVTLPESHTEHHWHTDSIHEVDSVIHETQTTIMQLDSAEMAKYGVKLKSAERAWLVRTSELERQIDQLLKLQATKDSVHDTISVPVPVEVKVPAVLSSMQRFFMAFGMIALGILIGLLILLAVKR